MRRSPFNTQRVDIDVRGSARVISTLRLFDQYRLLPANWMHALVPDAGSYHGAYVKLLKRLAWAGLLGRRTFDGSKNRNETLTYWRTDAGDRYLHERGFEALRHDGSHDAHQILLDMLDASIEIGARRSSNVISLHKWPDIAAHIPELEQPFRFEIADTALIPDGRPFYLKRAAANVNDTADSILFLKELDRNNQAPSTIKTKLKHYQALESAIKKRYRFAAMMVLFVTTNETRKSNMLKWTREVFNGDCKWVLVSTMHDHIRDPISTVPVTTHLFDEPYERAHPSLFSLRFLKPVQRPGISYDGGSLPWSAQTRSGFTYHLSEGEAVMSLELNK